MFIRKDSSLKKLLGRPFSKHRLTRATEKLEQPRKGQIGPFIGVLILAPYIRL